MGKVAYRNRQGRWVELRKVPATQVKNHFGSMLEETLAKGGVAIMRHETPKAVLLSYEEFDALVHPRTDTLAELEAEFDRWLDRQQSPKARKALDAAFAATPKDLGAAAVRAAKAKKRKQAGT
ncbi:MAG: type II toxin-antitoxin system Phd/YefM family antitoxin [Planctomycetota bacterium]|nr:type II toxin-antitoxin system Phd/YefM family antitoxin [Planctomycetota bacterium]